MKMEQLYSKADWALIKRFRSLPENEKEPILAEAQALVEDTIKTFMQTALKAKDLSEQQKKIVIEEVFGPIDQTELEAMDDLSQFSRTYDIALISAIIETMKHPNGQKAHSKKNGAQKRK